MFHLPVRGSGDGGIYSTAADIHALWRAFVAGRIVSTEWVAEMVRPRSDVPRQSMRYGLGFWLHASTDAVVLEGCDAGVSFRSLHDRRAHVTVTVISNTAEGAWPIARVSRERDFELTDVLQGSRYPSARFTSPPSTPPPPPANPDPARTLSSGDDSHGDIPAVSDEGLHEARRAKRPGFRNGLIGAVRKSWAKTAAATKTEPCRRARTPDPKVLLRLDELPAQQSSDHSPIGDKGKVAPAVLTAIVAV